MDRGLLCDSIHVVMTASSTKLVLKPIIPPAPILPTTCLLGYGILTRTHFGSFWQKKGRDFLPIIQDYVYRIL